MVTTKTIKYRMYFFGFDIDDSIDKTVERCLKAKIGAITGRKIDFVTKGVTDTKIREIQSKGIQVHFLWQPTNNNNTKIECSLSEQAIPGNICKFYDVTDSSVADARIEDLQEMLSLFPSMDGIQLEEPTIDLNGTTRTFENLAPIFTAFMQRIKTILGSKILAFNSPSLSPFGDTKLKAGLDVIEFDRLGIFDFVDIQTHGTLSPQGYVDNYNKWKLAMPNTIIVCGVYGWDAGEGGSTGRLTCPKLPNGQPDYGVRDCWNNDYLNAINILNNVNKIRVQITQTQWFMYWGYLNNWQDYTGSCPLVRGTWLECAIGNIPVPDECPQPQFNFQITQM